MALAVASYTEVANYYTNSDPTKTITGLSWSAGDAIVVVTNTTEATYTISSVTNANLTFTRQVQVETGSNLEAAVTMWTAIAGSSQSSQSIVVTESAIARLGFAVLVISGSPSGFANADGNNTEAAFSKTVSAGSVCIYAYGDWQARAAGRTGTTGSGTFTERRDNSDGSSLGQWIGTWVGTSAGTFSFGVTDYAAPTVLKVAHGFIEVLAPAAAGANSGFLALMGT